MKKLTLALVTGLMSVSGWSACTYNFDTTEIEIQQMSNNLIPPAKKFSSLNETTGSFTLESNSYQYWASTSSFLNSYKKYMNGTSSTITGDKTIQNTGRYSVELKINDFADIPNGTYVGNQSGVFNLGYNFFGIKNGSLKYGGFLWIVNSDQAKTKTVFVTLTDLSIGANYGKEFQLSYNTPNNYIVGLYFDQDARQIGINLNGIDKGFINNVPLHEAATQVSFQMYGTSGGYPASLPKTFKPTQTLIFDASQITLKYLTGTKDICGNTI
ncbi:DUF4882 family protein [Acinetobacter nematophilus]|uniref:DUF4882 family protein n=1 Tax=Acinetobacter nematophilus TaxID=2994642 RepID=UPI003AF4F534